MAEGCAGILGTRFMASLFDYFNAKFITSHSLDVQHYIYIRHFIYFYLILLKSIGSLTKYFKYPPSTNDLE